MKLRKKLSFISFIGIFLVTLPGLFFLYDLSRGNYLDKIFVELHAQTQANANIPIEHIRRAETSLATLAKALRRSLSQPSLASEISEFDSIVSKDTFGVTRNKPDLFDGTRQAGVFIPADVDITDKVKRTELRAMKLLSIYGQAMLQFFDGIWFDRADKTSVIFWRRDANFIYKLPPDHNYTQTLWDTLASPKLNPERVAKWTPVIQESPVGTWVVSCVYPVDIQGKWFGVLGHDIALTELINSFKQQDSYQHSQHFLFDAYGHFILAGPWQAQLEQKASEFKPDLSNEPELQALLQQKKASSKFQSISLQGKEYIVITMPIKGLDWKYIRLVPIDEVLAPMKILFLEIAGLILLISLLTTLLMYESINVLLVRPIQTFSEMLHNYGQGQGQDQDDIHLSYTSNDELGEMALIISTMAKNITAQQNDLVKSKTRYQQVVNSIDEVIFKLDEHGRIRFINEAWQSLSHVSRYDCVDHDLADYIHPDSLDKFKQKIELALRSPNESYRCELKLVNTEQEIIWVELNLQAISENDPHSKLTYYVLTGNMSDISKRKYEQLTNNIIAELEKEAIQGQSTEYILSLFCLQLAEALLLDLVWVVSLEVPSSQVMAAAGNDIHNLKHFNTAFFEQISTQEQLDITNSKQAHVLAQTEGYDCLAIPLVMPEREKAIVLFHTQKNHHFSSTDCNRLEIIIKKLTSTVQLAQDHKWMILHRTAIENTANAILITNHQSQIEWCNHAFTQLSGYEFNEIQGQKPSILNGGKQSSAFYQEVWLQLNAQKIWRGETVNKRKDGSFYTAVETITPLINKLNITTHFITVQEDISELKAAEERTRFLATHDFLTELPNRYLFREQLQHALDSAKRNKQKHAVLFMDLDGFKIINDSLGHQTGDIILQLLAQRLTNIVRQSDTIARIGGDEFVILLEDFNDIKNIATLSDKILNSFKQPFDVNSNHLQLTTSIGIAIYPDDGDNVDDLIRCADAAMYHAKEQGRNNCQSFTQKINDKIETRLILERDLLTAISQDQLELYYQPQMNISTNTVIGMEALVRWNHPDKGMIPPVEFIPFAEESGLIMELGDWVLQHACKQAHEWHQTGYPQLNISINISVRQLLHSEFINTVTAVLQQTQVNPKLITIELTESIMVNQPNVAVELLKELKQLGVNLSIDDFGTGYSSLQYLRLMPLYELKIDQSFIRDIHYKEGMAIIHSICALAKSMDLSLIAEGVEDADIMPLLIPLGCHHVQGYLYSKPLTVTDANIFLTQQLSEGNI